MTTLHAFSLGNMLAVYERGSSGPSWVFGPVFTSEDGASLFIAWLTDWRCTSPVDPSTDEQIAVADSIRNFLAPILGTELERVATTAELYQWYCEKQREIARAA